MSFATNLHSVSFTPPAAARHTGAGCAVCGSQDVDVDQVVDGASRLELGECPRCEHRWTRPLRAVRVSRAGTRVRGQDAAAAFPNAA